MLYRLAIVQVTGDKGLNQDTIAASTESEHSFNGHFQENPGKPVPDVSILDFTGAG